MRSGLRKFLGTNGGLHPSGHHDQCRNKGCMIYEQVRTALSDKRQTDKTLDSWTLRFVLQSLTPERFCIALLRKRPLAAIGF